MAKVNGIEPTIMQMILTGKMDTSRAVEIMDQGYLEEVGSYYPKNYGKTPIVPPKLHCTHKSNRVKTLCAYGIVAANGLAVDVSKYDEIVEEDNKQIVEAIKICNDFNNGLLNTDGKTPKIDIHTLDRRYLTWKNGYAGINEKFRREFPEVAESIKFIKGHVQFKFHVKRKPTIHTISQPYYTETGRCQYSFSKEYDGPLLVLSRRYRGIVDDTVDIYCIDIKAEEIAIAGALSNDETMMSDYFKDDIYNGFIKSSNLDISRDTAKVLLLGITKGMSAYTVAHQAKITLTEAKLLIDEVEKRYADYIKWSYCEAGYILPQTGGLPKRKRYHFLSTDLGLNNSRTLKTTPFNQRINSARSFRVSATASVILHRTVVQAVREQLPVVATLHDAVYVKGIKNAQRIVALIEENSSRYLNGLKLRTTIESFPNIARSLSTESDNSTDIIL